MIAKILGVGLTLGLFWAGCGDDPPPPAEQDPLADLPAIYTRITCGRIFSCCEVEERDDVILFDPAPTSIAECEAQYEIFFKNVIGDFLKGVDEGRLKYDAARADACFAKAEAASCADYFGSDFLDEDPDCEAAFQGTVALGGDCIDDDECKDPGASCVSSGSENVGTCTAPPGEGQPCDNGLCASGLTCRFGANGNMLQCLAPTADGGACSLDLDCQSGYCDFQAGVCATPAPAGSACVVNAGCASGYCDTGAGACAAKKADGADCVTGAECASSFCDDSGGAGVCTATKSDGAACMVSSECTSGLCDIGLCGPVSGSPVCDGI